MLRAKRCAVTAESITVGTDDGGAVFLVMGLLMFRI